MAKVKHISYTAEELEQILHRSESIAIKAQLTGVQDAGRNRLANQIKIEGQTYDLHSYYKLPIAYDTFGLVNVSPKPEVPSDVENAIHAPVYIDNDGGLSVLIIDDSKNSFQSDNQHTGTRDEIIHFFKENEVYY